MAGPPYVAPPRSVLKRWSMLVVVAVGALGSGCGGAEAGTVVFTSSGGSFVEPGAAEQAGGFVDGWSVKFDKLLVNLHQVQVARAAGEVAATSPASYFVDNAQPGSKQLVRFTDVTAKAWDRVSYQIKPAVASAVIVAGEQADLEMMVEAGYSLYVQGSGSKDDVSKTFAFGFDTATQYERCHAEQNGRDTSGIVVSDGIEDSSDLTTLGERLFSDRSSSVRAGSVELRFASIAAADDSGDADGDVTLDELEGAGVDARLYDTTGLEVEDLRQLVTAFARTVGHFRGAGECLSSDAK